MPMDKKIAWELVSVYINIMMRGEFDDHIQWPFKRVVRIQLINQREDGEHVERKVMEKYSRNEAVMPCVGRKQIRRRTHGATPSSFSTLISTNPKSREYLKNNTFKSFQ